MRDLRQSLTKWCGILVAATATLSGYPSAAGTTEHTSATRPNILWISCEDHGPDMPFYGDPHSHMPNLQKLADEGCVFTRAFSTAPVCSPSRSTIITGVHAVTIGTQHLRSSVPLPSHIKPFPAYLREAGYYCTNNVKTDYNFPIPEGVWDESSRRAHWRNRPNPDQPFFAVFNFTVTHEGKFKFNDKQYQEITKDLDDKYRVDPDTLTPPPYFPNTPVTRKDWARHYDYASQMDIEAGQILKQLEEDGLSSNTIVFFFSDHGVGLPRNKRWLYDAGLHVPLVVKWGGVLKPGSKNDELVSLMDLGPTVLSLLNIKIPDYMQGRVFLGKGKQPEPQYVFATRDRVDEAEDLSRSVRDTRYKYIRNFRPEVPYAQKSRYADENPTMREMRSMLADGTLTGPATLLFAPQKPVEEFYDTTTDPHEIKNLIDDPSFADRIQAMRMALKEWQEKVGDDMKPEPAEQKQAAERERKRRKRGGEE